MAERIEDVDLWREAWLDTPFRGKVHAEEHNPVRAARLPGNAVKTRKIDPDKRFPVTGVLVKFDLKSDIAIVRAHADMGERWIWKGTCTEYFDTWVVD